MSRWLAALLVGLAAPANAQVDQWSTYIEEASLRFQLPDDWIRRVMKAESGGRPMLDGRPITSSAGAMGLMQLMPATWSDMRTMLGLGPNPFDPRDNILAGAAYLRAMYDRFGYPGLFAAYNAGPRRYEQHLKTGNALPRETVAYVAKIAGSWARLNTPRSRVPLPPTLVVVGAETQAPPARASLFAIDRGTRP